jgi:hypothetical protein
MAKIAIRVVLILVVITLVSGITYLIFNNRSVNVGRDFNQGFEGNRLQIGQSPNRGGNGNFQPGGFEGGPDRGREGGDPLGIIVNLMKVLIISVVVMVIDFIIKKLKSIGPNSTAA